MWARVTVELVVKKTEAVLFQDTRWLSLLAFGGYCYFAEANESLFSGVRFLFVCLGFF